MHVACMAEGGSTACMAEGSSTARSRAERHRVEASCQDPFQLFAMPAVIGTCWLGVGCRLSHGSKGGGPHDVDTSMQMAGPPMGLTEGVADGYNVYWIHGHAHDSRATHLESLLETATGVGGKLAGAGGGGQGRPYEAEENSRGRGPRPTGSRPCFCNAVEAGESGASVNRGRPVCLPWGARGRVKHVQGRTRPSGEGSWSEAVRGRGEEPRPRGARQAAWPKGARATAWLGSRGRGEQEMENFRGRRELAAETGDGQRRPSKADGSWQRHGGVETDLETPGQGRSWHHGVRRQLG